MSNYDQQRALAPAAQAALAQVADEPARKMAQLYKSMLPNGARLSDMEALAGAMYARATGLDPIRGEFYIVPGTGVIPGYKGAQSRQKHRPFHYFFRPMTDAEQMLHEVKAGDIGVICLFTDIELAADMMRKGLQYQPTEGVGIVRGGERTGLAPKGRSWYWKCQQRSLKDALNHAPDFADLAREMDETADEILAQGEAEIPGYQRAPATAQLDAEQARAWVEKERRSARLRYDPEYAEQVTVEAHERGERNTLQRKWDDMVMGDEDCPYCGARSNSPSEHTNDCTFRQLYPNAARRPDIIEGEYTTGPANGGADEAAGFRLLSDLKAKFLGYSQQSQAPSSEAQRKAVAGAIDTLFGRDRACAQQFLKWAYGRERLDELTGSEASAIIKFVGSTKVENDWVPCAQAIEFAGVFRRIVVGQDTLI